MTPSHYARILKFLALASIASLASCAPLVFHQEAPKLPPRVVNEAPPVPTFGQGKPWEIWPYSRDFNGGTITSEGILVGDRLVSEGGDIREALIGWLQQQVAPLSLGEREALAYRIGSTYLSLGQPEQARSYLGRYFASSGIQLDQVSMHLSFLLAWVNGQIPDHEQALAWFSRAYQLAPNGSDLRLKAQEGVRYTFSTVPPVLFQRFEKAVEGDELLARLWLQEEQRRSLPGYVFQDPAPLVTRQAAVVAPAVEAQTLTQKMKVAVLLPLGGSFGSLGAKTKRGIELAFGPQEKEHIELHFIDSPQNADEAAAQTQQLLSGDHYSAILGPLLSDPSLTVSEAARVAAVPVLSLSKRESFPVGAGVYRLGVTTSSQVRSLSKTAMKGLGLSKFAIVAPEDATGRQFATAFREQVEAGGGTIVFETFYPKNDLQALTSIAPQVDVLTVDGVFFPDNLTNAARFFSVLSPSFRASARPLGTGNWDNKMELANSQEVLDRAVFVTPFFLYSDRKFVHTFVEAYQATYGDSPEFLAAQGFDAATLILAALAQQRNDGSTFEQALSSIDRYEGVTGIIKVQDGGEVVRDYSVVEYLGGQMRELPIPEGELPAPMPSSPPHY